MAFSKIVLSFAAWDSGTSVGDVVNFKVDGGNKNETAQLVRYGFGAFEYSGFNEIEAEYYRQAWAADYLGTNFTISRIGFFVTITATYDGAEFTDFVSTDGIVTATITNVPFAPEFELTGASLSPADTNKCTTVKVTLTEANGTPPFTWNTVLPGNVGLVGAVPRTGIEVTIEVEDSLAAISTINKVLPETIDNSDIDAINIEGDPSGLFGTVTILMEPVNGQPIDFEYSLDGATWQTSNVFTSVLVGVYTLSVRETYGCIITQEFEVTLTTIRPPVYRAIPKSNSFGWFEQQAAVSDCTNPYNGTNAKPNDYKPQRWYNPKYFQPWCLGDSQITQFRSNYDTLTASLINIATDLEVGTFPIVKKSNNLGQRQIMDARIYERSGTQTGVYWLSGNIYDTDHVSVIDTYALAGQLPEWVKVGQKFSLSGSAADGIFEITQIIFDSVLLVNAAIIDRVYTDVSDPVLIKVDAVYNRLNYETYEFASSVDVTEGCYKIILSMTDSLDEYPPSIWETFPFVYASAHKDLVLIESSDHIDDGILYSTGITHKQRFNGLFYDQDFPSNLETSRDSRKSLNLLDGRVQSAFTVEAIDVPQWVHEKLALFISKKRILINNLRVQFEEGWEREKSNATYTRVNLKAECFVQGYEQYLTNSYDIL